MLSVCTAGVTQYCVWSVQHALHSTLCGLYSRCYTALSVVCLYSGRYKVLQALNSSVCGLFVQQALHNTVCCLFVQQALHGTVCGLSVQQALHSSACGLFVQQVLNSSVFGLYSSKRYTALPVVSLPASVTQLCLWSLRTAGVTQFCLWSAYHALHSTVCSLFVQQALPQMQK